MRSFAANSPSRNALTLRFEFYALLVVKISAA